MGQRRFTQEINLKDAFKHTKKVKGYIQYNNIWLNDIGQLFAEENIDSGDFRQKYNAAVDMRIKTAQIFGEASEMFTPIPAEIEKIRPFSKAV